MACPNSTALTSIAVGVVFALGVTVGTFASAFVPAGPPSQDGWTPASSQAPGSEPIFRGSPAETVEGHAAPVAAIVLGASAAAALLVSTVTRRSTSAPRAAPRQLVAVRAFEAELGVQAPVGYFDPLGLSKDGDAATFKRRRTSELKHGRVAMLAAMGYIVPEYYKFPGYLAPSSGLKFDEVPNGLAALAKVPANGWLQIVLYLGTWEFPTYNSEAAPGDLGWKIISSTDPESKKRKLNSELANGRLAMMAIMGMLFQDGLTGSAWGDWALYTDSPLRAFAAPSSI